MILITTGTVNFSFNRLIQFSFEKLGHLNEKIIIQTGYSQLSLAKSANITHSSFFDNTKMIKLYRQADLIIAAAGEGTILQLLQFSRYQPLLFPRQKRYGEHVDDQQVLIARVAHRQQLAQFALELPALSKLITTMKQNPRLFTRAQPVINQKLLYLLQSETEQ